MIFLEISLLQDFLPVVLSHCLSILGCMVKETSNGTTRKSPFAFSWSFFLVLLSTLKQSQRRDKGDRGQQVRVAVPLVASPWQNWSNLCCIRKKI
jgi:hypothetical protein